MRILTTTVALCTSITLANAEEVIAPTIIQLNGVDALYNGLTGDGTIENGSATTNATLTVDVSSNQTFDGILQDGGAATLGLTKTGNSTLVLRNDNDISGDLAINGGTLQLGNNADTGSISGSSYPGDIFIAAGATLFDKSNTTTTLSGVISGAGILNKGGSGTLTLSGDNTYTGKTLILGSGAGGPAMSVSSFNSVTSGSIETGGGTVATPIASSSLGAPTTVADGTIGLGNSGNQRSSTLIYTGLGETTDRVIHLGFNNGSTHTISSNGSGLLKFTSPFTSSPSSGYSTSGVRLRGDNDGEIVNGIPFFPGILSKYDSGTWTLGGNNIFINATQLDGGVLSIAQPIGPSGIAKTVNTDGTPTVTVNPDTSGLVVGMIVYSANNKIADGQTIVSIDGPNTITLSANTNGGGGNTGLDARFGFSIGSLGFATSDPANLRWLNSATLNYTGSDDSTDRGFTVDNGDTGTWDIIGGTTLTVSGDSAATSGKIAKAGTGTLVLSGTLQHTGSPNAVNVGTLLINGDASTMTGAVEVAALATLGGTGTIGGDVTIADTGKLAFDLSTAPGGHDKLDVSGSLILPTGPETSVLTITSAGGATTGTYTLMTASGGITGDVPAVNLPGGWTANAPQIVSGTDLVINITSTGGGSSPYDTWAGGAAFSDDDNGDGVDNGLAWLLGAADPNANAISLLPMVTETAGGLVLTFTCLNDASNGDAVLNVEHSSDLGISDAWSLVVVPDSSGGPTSGVTFNVSVNVLDSDFNDVTATIDSAEATDGKLFGRLSPTE